jgi:hypothetical protein
MVRDLLDSMKNMTSLCIFFKRVIVAFVSAAALATSCTANAQSSASGSMGATFGINAKNLGAYGDCKHDDTAALQSAIDQINGRTLLLPAGCYRITQPIKIPLAGGFRIIGEGQYGTKILQETDNNPILVFTQELTQRFEIRDLEFAWAKPQPSQNTSSVAILFSTVTSTGAGIFNFNLSHLTFDNGFRGIYLGPGSRGPLPVWGFVIEDIDGERGMSGATIMLGPVPGTGMPRCILRNIYSQQRIAEAQITLHNCTSGTVDNIEDNNGVDTSLDLSGNWAMSVRGVHIEMHHMLNPTKPVISVENSKISFDGISAYVWSEVPGDYYLVSNVAGGGTLSLQDVTLVGTSPEFNRPSATNNAGAHSHLLRLNGPVRVLDLRGVDLKGADLSRSGDQQTAQRLSTLPKPVE